MNAKIQDMVSVLVWVPLEADPETSIQVWVISLKGGPRKPGRNVGKWVGEEKEASEGVVPSQLPDNWRLGSLEPS